MYTLVAVFVGARVIDFMQEGAYAAKGATIISEKKMRKLQKKILSKKWIVALHFFTRDGDIYKEGATRIILCSSKKRTHQTKKSIITSIDPHAFVAVNDVHDVIGEGFTLDENKKILFIIDGEKKRIRRFGCCIHAATTQ
ncbi:hypothetical protein GCM10020331_067470 [Ectobacillus funiculus]